MDVLVDQVTFASGSRMILTIPHLHFPHASTTALFGPNGSGKTTLLRLIAGLERPATGQVTAPPVAFAFQRPVFIRGTVGANLALGLTLREIEPEERRHRVLEAAREFGIEGLLDRSARALSAGEAQRVNLARALCLRAPVTLLDEPLAGIDRVSRGKLLDELPHLLRTFATTTIIVTHDREEAFRLADNLIVLVDGQVRASGPSGRLYRSPPDQLTAELLGYMIVQTPDAILAVPPGGLLAAPDSGTLEVTIDHVVDMGNHCDLIGRIGESRVSMRVPEGVAIRSGTRIRATVRNAVRLTSVEAPVTTGSW